MRYMSLIFPHREIKTWKKLMQMDQTKENKARMQEELIRTASSKIADREANAERARRMKEDKKQDEDVERQETETV